MAMDVEAAERDYARALELAGDAERPSLLARHAEALSQRSRFPEAARAYEEAIDGFRARGDIRSIAGAMAGQSVLLFRMGDPRGVSLSAEALAMLEPLGPSPELVRALTEDAADKVLSGEYAQGITVADRAIALAKELGLAGPARAMGFRGAGRTYLGDPGGLTDMRLALEAASAQGLGREVALLYGNLGEVLWPFEGPRSRLEVLREGRAYAERRGIEDVVLFSTVSMAQALADLGSYEEVIAGADDLARRLEASGDVFSLASVRSVRAAILVRRGQPAEAVPIADWAVEQARTSGYGELLAAAFPPVAAAHLAMGEAAEAAALLTELEGSPKVWAYPIYARSVPEVVRTALAAGDPDLAARLVRGIEPTFPLNEHALVTAAALLAEHRGEHAEAAGLFADAAERWEGFEMPWEEAQALFGRGRCLLALGRPAEADAPLRGARDIFVSLGAGPAVLETDELLERATALTS
jgi:tetratricopeptide (TPR) repeat protein